MSACKLICYFSSLPVAFEFQAASAPGNITLNPANKKTDQSLSGFQTGIGGASQVILDTKELFSHTKGTCIDTIA